MILMLYTLRCSKRNHNRMQIVIKITISKKILKNQMTLPFLR